MKVGYVIFKETNLFRMNYSQEVLYDAKVYNKCT